MTRASRFALPWRAAAHYFMTWPAIVGLSVGLWSTAQAAVGPEQAGRLGKDLTAYGAEQAGNATGEIPPWDGGLTEPPEGLGYSVGQHHPNPFSADQELYEVTPENAHQYEDRLTRGYRALLKAYPSYKMPVYQTRRSCAFPERAYRATRANATSARLTTHGNSVTGALMAPPFPIASSGLEMIWNHLLRFRTFKVTRQEVRAAPTEGGSFTPSKARVSEIYWWGDPSKKSTEELDNVTNYYHAETIEPASQAGRAFIVYETLNQEVEERKAWLYDTERRRVLRSATFAYDNPVTGTDAMATSDNINLFNGSPNLYDWTFVGKRELLVPYNTYDIASGDLKYADIFQSHHLNQDLMRYELHRVWVYEARLKENESHIYTRRTFYADEDTWQILAVDLYNRSGELFRVQESHLKNFYEVPLCQHDSEVIYDLNAGRYVASQFKNEEPPINHFADELKPADFEPQELRRGATR